MLVSEVLPGLFMVRVPLPGSPLKALNSYVIRAERPLIIDTGFNMDVCYAELVGALREIGVNYGRADYFITHFHPDHLGLASRLTNSVYMGDIEIEVKRNLATLRSENLRYFEMNGVPRKDIEEMAIKLREYVEDISNITFRPFKDGEVLKYGDYKLRTILTPGHTPGHMCLYDEEKKILFSGDHILFDTTPNISYWSRYDTLKEYINSLDKIYELDIDLVFPGHGRHQGGVRKRILELKGHHKRRLEEIIAALKSGVKNAWEISRHITWNISYSNWDNLPAIQKWFIISETLAHITYLENIGLITKENKDGKICYIS
ncbi:MAG: MBL fold metallo-hydrolase [Candidatus Bathyarchaeia archaeon]